MLIKSMKFAKYLYVKWGHDQKKERFCKLKYLSIIVLRAQYIFTILNQKELF